MRGALLLVLLLLSLAPLAAAETWNLRAGGATVSPDRGVAGVQVGDGSAVGVRYWQNETSTGASAVVLTTCYTPGSHAVVYCERHWLHA